jgi:hypothetical protein
MTTGVLLPSVVPSGFIFHISRCGSTLISNALRTGDSVTCLSELPVITSIVYQNVGGIERGSKEELRRTCLSALDAVFRIYANVCSGGGQRLIVKFTSWNLMAVGAIRSLFPSVPSIIVIRKPVEVIVSNLGSPAAFMGFKNRPLLAASLLGCATSVSDAEFCAQVLGQLFKAASRVVDSGCRVVDYENLGAARLCQIGELFGIPLAFGSAQLDAVLRRYSKDPGIRAWLQSDEVEKREYSESVGVAAARWADPFYAELKSLEKW